MCRTCGRRHNSIVQDGSPAQLQDASSLESSGSSSIPFSLGLRSPGKVSPLRGRTMKEYEEQLASLKRENFSLKLRIYFLEERMGQKFDKEDKKELYHTNIELKVEAEALKQELCDKQELVRQASTALSGLEHQFQEQLATLRHQHQQEKEQLHHKIQQLQKHVEEYEQQIRGEGGRHGDLTQLCGLAFSGVEDEDEEPLSLPSREKLSLPIAQPLSLPLGLPGPHSFAAPSPVQGLFSLAGPDKARGAVTPGGDAPPATHEAAGDGTAQAKVACLEARVAELELRVEELEGELAAKEDSNTVLEGDIANLKRELEDKVEKIAELEVEVVEKDLKIDDVMQELETRHTEIQAKDTQIQCLHHDLSKVEPEIEVKVQEIVERDRIIEEKIEQIEQQNKILVEIQITLDEKQKQIADLEQKITEHSEKITALNTELDKACKTIQAFAEEVETRDKEIAALKKEVKRKEKKIKDLVAELKEALDMLNKAKWEAETSGGEDGVKEMAEEENERLWAELESRKNEVLALRAEHKHSLDEAQQRVAQLQEQLDDKLRALQGERDKHSQDVEEREARMRELVQQVARLEGQLQALHGDMDSREGQLRTNQDLVQGLKDELAAVKDELRDKRRELEAMQEELKRKNAGMQDLVNKELWERNKEVEKLHEKLSALTSSHQHQIDGLKQELSGRTTEGRPAGHPVEADRTPVTFTPVINANVTLAASSDQPRNAAHLANITRPLHLSLADTSVAPVQLLFDEISKVRGEAQALKLERSILNDKLQQLNEQVSLTADTAKGSELRHQLDSVKQQLEESKEQSLQQERQHGEVVSDFQSQVQTLRDELHHAKKKINRQLTEVRVRKYQDSLKRHKQEIASLRKRLADSHNACDMLRTRLEELADFLERILEMEDQGLINLSQFSAKHRASLHKTLNESRALSRSLSQSLMIGMDEHADEGLLSSCSLSSMSSWSLQREDSLSEPHEYEAAPSLPEDSVVHAEDATHDPAFQALASQLNTQIDQKTQEIDAIAENVCVLSEQLAERTRQVEQQAGVIGELRGQLGRLQDEVRLRDLQLTAHGDHGDHGDHDATQTIHGSWHSGLNPLTASSQSTVHAVSPQRTVEPHDYSSQEHLSQFSDTLPPPPLHLLQDSECEEARHDTRQFDAQDVAEVEFCQVSDRSSLSAVKSAYSTDAAIKANSRYPHYFQLAPAARGPAHTDARRGWMENASGPGALVPEQPWAPVSPSESEAWSEPDRNVSLARIGLDACTLGGAPDRAMSRSRQQRATAAITSESDGDAMHDDTLVCSSNTAATPGKTPKRRSDIAELRRVSTKLRAVEQLNETLRAELNIYQTLSHQLLPQDKSHERPKTSDKSVETHKGETVDASVGAEDHQPPPPTFTIPTPILDEIRALRLKLEEAISNNDHLRDQLEVALTAHPQDEARFHHLTAALQIGQEEVREARERLQCTQEALRTQQELTREVQHRCREREQTLDSCKAALEASHQQLTQAKADLARLGDALKEKEALVVEQDGVLHDKDCQLAELKDALVRTSDKNLALEQRAATTQDQHANLVEMKTAMQKQETRLLELNKERLALVGDKAKLQAQLASLSTRTRLLRDDQQEAEEGDEERGQLMRQLEASQVAAAAVHQENQQLIHAKETLEKKLQILEEERTSLQARLSHFLVREAHTSQASESEQRSLAEMRSALAILQHAHKKLQDKYEEQDRELSAMRTKLMKSEVGLACAAERETLVKQLTAQLESERCLTNNLQIQLDSLSDTLPSHRQDSVVPNPCASDLASPESVTSFEFFSAPTETNRSRETYRTGSLGPTSPVDREKCRERRAVSSVGTSGRRRDGSRRISNHWSEDKENLHSLNTSSKRGRRAHSTSSTEGVLSQQAPLLPGQHPEEDGGTTSGESPDLGIGSDYPFSSLERGTRLSRAVMQENTDVHRTPLCSDPNHSNLQAENHRLRADRDNLTDKLLVTKDTLRDALDSLAKANQRKETIERAMCTQLTKTHHVLKKTKFALQHPPAQ